MYCPEPKCKRSKKQPFSAATEDDLVGQILQHAESEDTCDHFVGRKKKDLDNIIRLHWHEGHGWRDPRARSASPSSASASIPRRRSRSPRRAVSSEIDLFTDLANQTGELMEAATRLHQSVMRAKQRLHPIHPVYPRG